MTERADLFCGCAFVRAGTQWRQVVACPDHEMDMRPQDGDDPKPVRSPLDAASEGAVLLADLARHAEQIGKAAAAARARERQRIAAVISPEQFRKLAEWFDADDEFKEAMFPETWSPGSRQDDVQRDLRKVADLLEGDPS